MHCETKFIVDKQYFDICTNFDDKNVKFHDEFLLCNMKNTKIVIGYTQGRKLIL